jgi:hypothetical protein
MADRRIPTIETERLLLRGSTAGDVDTWGALLEDADVRRYLPKFSQPIRERAALHIQWCDAAWEEEPQTDVSWMIALKQTGELIGRCGCGTLEGSNEAEVIYTLGKPYRDAAMRLRRLARSSAIAWSISPGIPSQRASFRQTSRRAGCSNISGSCMSETWTISSAQVTSRLSWSRQ